MKVQTDVYINKWREEGGESGDHPTETDFFPDLQTGVLPRTLIFALVFRDCHFFVLRNFTLQFEK